MMIVITPGFFDLLISYYQLLWNLEYKWRIGGEKIVSGGNDGVVNIWHVETGDLLPKLEGHKRGN